jgi:chromate transporter
MNPVHYFWLFLKASLFSTGGFGNLPFLTHDLLALNWATSSDFATAIAVGNLSPGPNGLWSVSLGYLTFGWAGAFIALAALSLPPLLILVVSASYDRIEHRPLTQYVTRGLGIGVIGMSLAVSWSLMADSITDWRAILIMLGAFALALNRKVPIILILASAALAGLLFFGK